MKKDETESRWSCANRRRRLGPSGEVVRGSGGHIDTDNVEPLASVTGHGLPQRADAVTDGNRVDDVLANVPETASGFFVVPKVVE